MLSPVAIITGAGTGIGRATAIELSTRGYRTALIGRRLPALEQTAAQINHPQPLTISADVSKPDQVTRLIQTTLQHFGRIDAIVNNAGSAPMRTIEDLSFEDWQHILNTNLSAAFYLIKAAWPALKQSGGGAIVNISSLAARDPFPGLGAYGAAKAGLNLLGLALAREGVTHNIRVHTIAPGAVETDMFRKLFTPEQYSPEKTLRPEQIAAAIVQCIAGDLQYTSGEVIYLHRDPA